MIGRVVSIVVAPPEDMGASFPKYFTSSGAKSSVISSRIMFESSAMVPKTGPLYSVMNMLERE